MKGGDFLNFWKGENLRKGGGVDLEKGVMGPLTNMIVLRSMDPSLTCRSNTSSICRQFYDLQIVLQSADSSSI